MVPSARTRTADLLITNQLLYQLSYKGFRGFCIAITRRLQQENVQRFRSLPPSSQNAAHPTTKQECFRCATSLPLAILPHPTGR